MALLHLRSSNPDFSWIIHKDPNSKLPSIRRHKRGRSFGWYSEQNKCYNIFFKDSDTQVSYAVNQSDNSFEFQNCSRYNSALFPIDAIQSFLSSTVKRTTTEDEPEIDVDGFENSLTVNMMYIKNVKYIEIFQDHIDGFAITHNSLAENNYRITFSTTKSIRELLNFVNLFCIFNALKNDRNSIDLNPDLVKKYLSCLQVIDPPYFVRYVFKVNLLRNKKIFKEYKEILEASSKHKSIDMTYGSTNVSRQDFVLNAIPLGTNIVDVGCGEGAYANMFARRFSKDPDSKYIGVDIDEAMVAMAKKKVRNRVSEGRCKEDQFEFFTDVGDIEMTHNNDNAILLIEVIEHMPMDEAVTLVNYCLNALKPDKMIITTPNREFNKFYSGVTGYMRHDDHCFELDRYEFENLIASTTAGRYKTKFFGCGDAVDGVQPTQGCILEK